LHQAYTAMQFKITTDLLEQIRDLIAQQDVSTLEKLLVDFHFADVAEIIDELSLEDAVFIVKLLDSEKTSEALMELDEDQRKLDRNQLRKRDARTGRKCDQSSLHIRRR